jgi:hypothetical protein
MALLDAIMGAVANPAMQGNSNELGSILGAVQQMAGGQGADNSATNAMMSIVGSHVKGALQNQRSNGVGVEDLINQFGGMTPNPSAVSAIFSPQQQQDVTNAVSQQTGLNGGAIAALLPVVVPMVLNMLKSGAPQGNVAAQSGGNPVLNAFLDSDRDGDTDIGDILSMAGNFMR